MYALMYYNIRLTMIRYLIYKKYRYYKRFVSVIEVIEARAV